MPVFAPLAYLAALFAVVTAVQWWGVASMVRHHGSDAARVNRKLYLAALGTSVTLALFGASTVAIPIANMLI